MTFQLKKITSLLLVLVLVVSGVAAMGLVVQAAGEVEPTGPNEVPKDELTPYKRLFYPEGTVLPAEGLTFSFTLTQVAEANQPPNYPYIKIGDGPGLYTKTESVTINSTADAKFDSEKGSYSSVQVKNLLTGIKFPEAGYYTFTLIEALLLNNEEVTVDSNGIYSITDTVTNSEEKIKFSRAQYQVMVEVIYKEGALAPHRIGVTQTQDQDGKANDNPPKIDPTPGEVTGAKFVFDNTYNVVLSTKPSVNSDQDGLKISKTVAGALGDKKAFFPFQLTLTNPTELIDASTAYDAYILQTNEDGTTTVKMTELNENGILTPEQDGTFSIKIVGDDGNATPFAFKLKDGESLHLIEAPVGLKWQAAETNSLGHKPTAKLNGEDTGTTKGQADGSVSSQKIFTTAQQILEKARNRFEVTNELSSTEPPTGLFYDNLPFIVLLVLAAMGIIFFASKKSNRRREQA